MRNVIVESDIFKKIKNFPLHYDFGSDSLAMPLTPGRDVRLITDKDTPQKLGLNTLEGQGRLLHDLANIELQAMELCCRTLHEFPLAPKEFRSQLFAIAIEERKHLQLCLNGLQALGFAWGQWPVHLLLWSAVDASDTLIDRILIVHRYLEGAGLDSGEAILRKLSGVKDKRVQEIVKIIADDELKHVSFGSDWYKKLCDQQNLDSDIYFKQRLLHFRDRIPKRSAQINSELRQRAGFTTAELEFVQDYQNIR